jgi:hypothetical protein
LVKLLVLFGQHFGIRWDASLATAMTSKTASHAGRHEWQMFSGRRRRRWPNRLLSSASASCTHVIQGFCPAWQLLTLFCRLRLSQSMILGTSTSSDTHGLLGEPAPTAEKIEFLLLSRRYLRLRRHIGIECGGCLRRGTDAVQGGGRSSGRKDEYEGRAGKASGATSVRFRWYRRRRKSAGTGVLLERLAIEGALRS